MATTTTLKRKIAPASVTASPRNSARLSDSEFLRLTGPKGTMTVKRFVLKLKAYAAYWMERRHEEKFGIRYFRVLTVTTTAARAENLRTAAAQEEDVRRLSRLFLFTDVGKLALERPERVCEEIWTSPEMPEPQSLLGARPGKSQ